jgi:hypothetical protein
MVFWVDEQTYNYSGRHLSFLGQTYNRTTMPHFIKQGEILVIFINQEEEQSSVGLLAENRPKTGTDTLTNCCGTRLS